MVLKGTLAACSWGPHFHPSTHRINPPGSATPMLGSKLLLLASRRMPVHVHIFIQHNSPMRTHTDTL